jgi:hypothetical protein
METTRSTSTTEAAAPEITAAEVSAIAVEAYVYLYPLVMMDVSRKQLTNLAAGQEFGKGPRNMFVNAREYPPAGFKGVVRPNFDTLYSTAWLDLTDEPLAITTPDTNGLFYLLPMIDMWTDVFASPGWRTTGTAAATYLLTPPGWSGTVPEAMTHLPAPTPYVWVIGRTKTDGPQDYEAVHQIQDGYTLTQLSQWGQQPTPVEVVIDPDVDMTTPPMTQVDTMPGETYFAYAAELLKLNPPHATDQPVIARMRRIGIEPGQSLDLHSLDPEVRAALTGAPGDAQELMGWKVQTLAPVVNGWSMNTDTMGVYGNYYLKRAIVAQIGLGANLPEDALYPLNLVDGTGQPLHGANTYTMHFEQGATPPVEAFWSITLYDKGGFVVANPLNRFAVSNWMPFTYNADGSLDLYIQHESPGPDQEANWLPAPEGDFNLTMRLYAPQSDALTGKWNPPPVTKTA